MSYDINFWRLDHPLKQAPVDIYRSLCQGEIVDGLASLPVAEIHSQLRQAFPEFDPSKKFPTFRTSVGSIEVSWSNYHFRFDLRGDYGPEAQTIVEIMAGFRCPLFDPQLNQRYDSKEGMAVGESPKFNKKPSGPKAAEFAAKAAELQKLRLEVLARIKNKAKSD